MLARARYPWAARLTYDIVAVIIANHLGEKVVAIGVLAHESLSDSMPNTVVSILNALLHHIGRKLVLAISDQIFESGLDHHPTILGAALSDDILRDVVTEAINNEESSTGLQFLHDDISVLIRPILHEPLNDTAPILLCRNFKNGALESLHDEIKIRAGDDFDDFLNHMIAADVLSHGRNMGLQLLNKSSLLVNEDVFKSLGLSVGN